jgi:hypothetical protein
VLRIVILQYDYISWKSLLVRVYTLNEKNEILCVVVVVHLLFFPQVDWADRDEAMQRRHIDFFGVFILFAAIFYFSR